MNLDTLKDALESIFRFSPPKKELSVTKIKKIISEYLCIDEFEILTADLIQALRESSVACPKPATKGSSNLNWVFINKQEVDLKKTRRKVYKDRPIAVSQKLKK